MSLINHVKRNFLVDAEGIEYIFWCTGASGTTSQKADSLNGRSQKVEDLTTEMAPAVTAGRMDIGTVMRSYLEPGHQTTVLVCGPGAMADEATRHVIKSVKGGYKVDLMEEAYAW
jgi:hypothetical protein